MTRRYRPNTIVGLAAAGFAIIGLAGCASTSAPATSTTSAAYPFACNALTLGSQGDWAGAQHRWLSAEQSASDGGAVAAFLVLNVDSGMLAADHLTGKSQAADLATYHSDLSGDSAYTAGCR
jgi:hypothetical protein